MSSVTLIKTKDALAMMPFITYHGLYKGCKGTDVLTRYPHGLYSKEEIEEYLASIVAKGESRAAKRQQFEDLPEELV